VARIPKRLPRDVNARAIAIARALINEDETNLDTRPLDTIGTMKARARKGGIARKKSISPLRRTAIAKAAAQARWQKK
jgi:hypothetical protein